MLFYSFDLDEYISSRGFYYEYLDFIPGKLVESMNEIITAISIGDFEENKIKNFKKNFFDYFDGKSGRRVCEFINQLIANRT